jgi:Cu2+-exporting ATPase
LTTTTVSEPSNRKTNDRSQTVACDHCGLCVPQSLLQADAVHQFCCSGCQMAFQTIHGCGLAEYYEVLDRFANNQAIPATGKGSAYASYDTEVFLSRHSTDLAGGLKSIQLRLEGVHCAACIWLIERLPTIVTGVIKAQLSLTSSRLDLAWDPQQVSLAQVATALDQLGYAPHPSKDVTSREVRQKAERGRLIHMAIAGALAGNNMLISLALYAGIFNGIEPHFQELFRWLSLGIGWLSLTWPGRIFFRSAWASLRARTTSLDQPIALALAVGGLAGTINVVLGRGEVFFDSLSVLVFLLLVGRFVQARQQRWAEDSIGLLSAMTPDSCRVLREGSLSEETVESLAIGDEVEVRAGELFPADGEVTLGNSTVDRSLLTGESLAHPAEIGDTVFAGSQNISDTLRVRVTSVGLESRVGKILQLIDEGVQSKPPVVQFADRVAGKFVVAVAFLATVNLLSWALFVSVPLAVDATVSLLIVACPCALGLATPLTMALAIGRCARRGVLVKSADVIERMASVRDGDAQPSGRLLLDKTGTLTLGKMTAIRWHGDPILPSYVAALEADSNHPIATALAQTHPKEETPLPLISDREEKHGHGVKGQCDLGKVSVGSAAWMLMDGIEYPLEFSEIVRQGDSLGFTNVLITVNDSVRAVVWLSDTIQLDVATSLGQICQEGWLPEIVSGDGAGAVNFVAHSLGISPEHAFAEMTPEAKLEYVRKTQAAKQSANDVVVMVGDGVNDAAALAAADVGIAVHGGAEASLAAADVYTRASGIGGIVDLVRLSRRAMGVIRLNLGISLTYNFLAIALAASGSVTPLVAAILMPISSATVLGVAIYGLAFRSLGKREASNACSTNMPPQQRTHLAMEI